MIINLRENQGLGQKAAKTRKFKLGRRLLVFSVLLVTGLVQIAAMSAFESHILNVTARVYNDVPHVFPDGRQFCNTGPTEITLSTDAANAEIIYTLDGTDPVCGADIAVPDNGLLYTDPFLIYITTTVKASTCHNPHMSAVMTWEFELSPEFCEGGRIVINKVMYYPDYKDKHGCDEHGEWIELYNGGDTAVDVSGWKILDNNYADVLPPSPPIPPQGFAVIAGSGQIFNYIDIPGDIVKILIADGQIGDGLGNEKDMLQLVNLQNEVVDQMNWGLPRNSWPNNPGDLWNPGIVLAPRGYALSRVPTGFDTDQVSDWQPLGLPQVELLRPNWWDYWHIGDSEEIKWEAKNRNGDDSELKIDIYYSGDNGHSWAVIATSTDNDGIYVWEIPERLSDGNYYVPSDRARIKIVARGPENFMIQASGFNECYFTILRPNRFNSLKSLSEIIQEPEGDTPLYYEPCDEEHSNDIQDIGEPLDETIEQITIIVEEEAGTDDENKDPEITEEMEASPAETIAGEEESDNTDEPIPSAEDAGGDPEAGISQDEPSEAGVIKINTSLSETNTGGGPNTLPEND